MTYKLTPADYADNLRAYHDAVANHGRPQDRALEQRLADGAAGRRGPAQGTAMYKLTTRDQIHHVAYRYEAQYHGRTRPLHDGSYASDKLVALKALDKAVATAADVATIIGNNSWTRLACDECEAACEAVCVVGNGYGDCVSICADCITRMQKKMEAV